MIDLIRLQAANILSSILEVTVPPQTNPYRKDTASWDSLRHMELILLLEEEFNIRFSIKQVAGIQSLDDIVNMVGEYNES